MTDEPTTQDKSTNLYDKICAEMREKQAAAKEIKERANELFGTRKKDELDRRFNNK
jgi:hypothetical protein